MRAFKKVNLTPFFAPLGPAKRRDMRAFKEVNLTPFPQTAFPRSAGGMSPVEFEKRYAQSGE